MIALSFFAHQMDTMVVGRNVTSEIVFGENNKLSQQDDKRVSQGFSI